MTNEAKANPEFRPRRLRFALALCLIPATLAASDTYASGDASQSGERRDQLIDGLADSYNAISQLNGLEVEYRIEREILERGSSLLWPWEWGEVTVVLRPVAPGKLYTIFRRPMEFGLTPNKNNKRIFQTHRSCDNEFWAQMETEWPPGSVKATIASVARRPFHSIESYCHYFRYLAYPVSTTPEAGLAERTVYPPNSYWLPDALRVNRSAYALRVGKENVDGVPCEVITREGLDTLWIQTKPGFILRRRVFHWGPGQAMRQDVTLRDHSEVATGVWLPRTLLVDWYTAPWDPPPVVGRVGCRFKFSVSKLESGDFPESRFRITIPPGAEVQDDINSEDVDSPLYFINRAGEDPFERAGSHHRAASIRRSLFIFGCIGVTSLIVLLVVWRWRHRKSLPST